MPPVGVKPNASHLPDKCPRLLDHRDFPVLSLITYPSDSCMSTAVAINIYIASSAYPFCADVLQLCICSVHLPAGLPSSEYLNSQNIYAMKIINIIFRTFLQDRKGKVPLVGVKPDASHLPDECPRIYCYVIIQISRY